MTWSFVDEPELTPENLVAARLTDGNYEIELLGYLHVEPRTAAISDFHVQGRGANTLGTINSTTWYTGS